MAQSGDEDQELLVQHCVPGVYTVSHDNAVVRRDASRQSPMVARLRAGAAVFVAEVRADPADDRVRGRILDPAGWITLLQTGIGYQWATNSLPVEAGKARLVEEIVGCDHQLAELQARVDQLRAEHEVQLGSFAERTQALEARLLATHLKPVGTLPRAPPHAQAHHPPQVTAAELDPAAAAAAAAWQRRPCPTLPPGARVLEEVHMRLSPEEEKLVALPLEELSQDHPHHVPPKAKEEANPDAPTGHFITSNAVLLPSPNHAPAATSTKVPLVGVYAVTRPPPGVLKENLYEGMRLPEATPERYHADFAGAWRHEAVRVQP